MGSVDCWQPGQGLCDRGLDVGIVPGADRRHRRPAARLRAWALADPERPVAPAPQELAELDGHLDLAAYDAYLTGAMTDRSWDDADIQASVAQALSRLPAVN